MAHSSSIFRLLLYCFAVSSVVLAQTDSDSDSNDPAPAPAPAQQPFNIELFKDFIDCRGNDDCVPDYDGPGGESFNELWFAYLSEVDALAAELDEDDEGFDFYIERDGPAFVAREDIRIYWAAFQAGVRASCGECDLLGTHSMSLNPDGTFEYHYCAEHYQVIGACAACGIELHPDWDIWTWPSRTYCRPCRRNGDPDSELALDAAPTTTAPALEPPTTWRVQLYQAQLAPAPAGDEQVTCANCGDIGWSRDWAPNDAGVILCGVCDPAEPAPEPPTLALAPAPEPLAAQPASENAAVLSRFQLQARQKQLLQQLETDGFYKTEEDYEMALQEYTVVTFELSGAPDTCPICLDSIVDGESFVTGGCGHTVHLQCYTQNIQSGRSMAQNCPVCRVPYLSPAPAPEPPAPALAPHLLNHQEHRLSHWLVYTLTQAEQFLLDTTAQNGTYSALYVPFIHAVLQTGDMQHQINIWQEIFGAHWTQFVETYRPFIGLVTV